jgi:hypothetical protein
MSLTSLSLSCLIYKIQRDDNPVCHIKYKDKDRAWDLGDLHVLGPVLTFPLLNGIVSCSLTGLAQGGGPVRSEEWRPSSLGRAVIYVL